MVLLGAGAEETRGLPSPEADTRCFFTCGAGGDLEALGAFLGPSEESLSSKTAAERRAAPPPLGRFTPLLCTIWTSSSLSSKSDISSRGSGLGWTEGSGLGCAGGSGLGWAGG